MNRPAMDTAKREAQRFLACVASMEKLCAQGEKDHNEKGWWPYVSMQAAALRRSSLDLTRALAALRKP